MENTVIRVKKSAIAKSRKTDKEYSGFSVAYDNLPFRFRSPVKDQIVRETGWSPANFHYKRRGDSPLREDEIPVIERAFAEAGIDWLTGKPIN